MLRGRRPGAAKGPRETLSTQTPKAPARFPQFLARSHAPAAYLHRRVLPPNSEGPVSTHGHKITVHECEAVDVACKPPKRLQLLARVDSKDGDSPTSLTMPARGDALAREVDQRVAALPFAVKLAHGLARVQVPYLQRRHFVKPNDDSVVIKSEEDIRLATHGDRAHALGRVLGAIVVGRREGEVGAGGAETRPERGTG